MEEAGLATTSISLVRENTVALRPPRALWVSFALGRPFGVPGEAAFQRRVLRAALALLERQDGPVILEDYPEDAPDDGSADPEEDLVCPVKLPKPDIAEGSQIAQQIKTETDALLPWCQMSMESRGRTTVGVSGLDIDAVIALLAQLEEGEDAEGRSIESTTGEMFRSATEDLRNWYLEAAGARPGGSANSEVLADWFWRETAAGALIVKLRAIYADSRNEGLREVAEKFLVPRAQKHLLG